MIENALAFSGILRGLGLATMTKMTGPPSLNQLLLYSKTVRFWLPPHFLHTLGPPRFNLVKLAQRAPLSMTSQLRNSDAA